MLQIVKENYAEIEVIMTSAVDEVETVVQAMRHGAFHYLTKEVENDALQSLVRHAIERQALNRQVLSLSAQVADQPEPELLLGPSKSMREIGELVEKVSRLSATVLILGESGTGKELLARRIHQGSAGSDTPFIAVNVAAIPADLVESTLFGHERGAFTGAHRQQLGKFELAAGGTLFLDEIGDLRIDLQAKLLRAIQEEEIERIGNAKPIPTDFRLIVATNTDLAKAVKEGRFREDLYYPDQRHPDPHAAAEGAHRGHSRPVSSVRVALQPEVSQGGRGCVGLGREAPVDVLVARQHPRTGKPHRTASRGDRPAVDHGRGSAHRIPSGSAGYGSGRRRKSTAAGV